MNIINVTSVLVMKELEDQLAVLFVDRQKPPYLGNLALPGGKVELGEQLHESASRELEEETGISILWPRLFATLNERLYNNKNEFSDHIILHYFRHENILTERELTNMVESDEGELKWIKVSEIKEQEYKNEIIPSDYKIILNILEEQSNSNKQFSDKFSFDNITKYYECKMKTDNGLAKEKLTLLNWEEY